MWGIGRRGRRRILAQSHVEESTWRHVCDSLPLLAGLDSADLVRLRELALLFLYEKSIEPAGDFTLDEEMRLLLALQASLPILVLGIDWYRGWTSIVVYPDRFVAACEEVDEAGVVHSGREARAGESWERGPPVLSWEDVRSGMSLDGYNVVVHELAHKLDSLNGPADGFPPLHSGMDPAAWTAAFGHAFRDLSARVDRDEPTAIDPYGAESPAEFFAVVSETFFELPTNLQGAYPAVYEALRGFYRQDPASRLPG